MYAVASDHVSLGTNSHAQVAAVLHDVPDASPVQEMKPRVLRVKVLETTVSSETHGTNWVGAVSLVEEVESSRAIERLLIVS